MDRLIWTAVNGMAASMTQQRMIANNMANAQTVGFRAEVLRATPITLTGTGVEGRAMSDTQVHGARMDKGAISPTGRALDVALQGDAMIAVQATNGEEAYTRRGDLTVTVNGILINGDGVPVLGASGNPVSVPPGSDLSIAEDGAVMARNPAQPDAPPTEVDRIKLANWRGSQIVKGLDGLFRVPEGGALPQDEEARLIPAALEGSNVNTADALVDMIAAQRLFDIRTKLISTAREVDRAGESLLKMV